MAIWDQIKSATGNVVNKISSKIKQRKLTAKQEQEESELLQKWKSQYETDRREKLPWSTRFDQWETLYQGSRIFDNVVDQLSAAQKQVRTIVNFPRMVVESLIEIGIPEPTFKAVAKDDEDPVQEIKNYVSYVTRSASPSLEEINLINERRNMKFGCCFWKIHWNNSAKRGGYVGDIEISAPHPKDIIPNSGATSMDDLEHYHHPVNRTAKYILRKWKHLTQDDLEQKATLFKEYDDLGDDSQDIMVGSVSDLGTKESGLNKYTIIETTYKDEDGDIGKIWWSDDLLISHLPKFYYRRDENGEILYTEKLDPGTVIRAGMDKFRTIEGIEDEEGILQGEEVEYFIPTSWDLIMQVFIPRDKCFWPISIFEDVKDLAETIKKLVYILEETYLRGDTKIIVGDDELKNKLLDPLSEVIVSRNTDQVKVVSFKRSDGIVLIEKFKEWMQLLTGTTNAALGVHDPGVKSGKQAQLYVEQSNGKMQLKSAYKATAYKKLYRTVSEFAMSFVDDERPFRLAGDKSNDTYGTFNRLNMLKDQSGNIVTIDLDIDISAEAGLLKSRADVFNSLVNLAGQGRFEPTPGNIVFLKLLAKLGVPMLEDAVEQLQAELDQQKQMAQQQMQAQQGQGAGDAPPQQQTQGADTQGILDALPPEIQQMILQLPPEEQQKFLSQPPEVIADAVQKLMQGQQGGIM